MKNVYSFKSNNVEGEGVCNIYFLKNFDVVSMQATVWLRAADDLGLRAWTGSARGNSGIDTSSVRGFYIVRDKNNYECLDAFWSRVNIMFYRGVQPPVVTQLTTHNVKHIKVT